MNCCDDFGNCTQGRNCPVRQQMVEQPPPQKKDRVVWVLVGAVFFCMAAIGWIMRLK